MFIKWDTCKKYFSGLQVLLDARPCSLEFHSLTILWATSSLLLYYRVTVIQLRHISPVIQLRQCLTPLIYKCATFTNLFPNSTIVSLLYNTPFPNFKCALGYSHENEAILRRIKIDKQVNRWKMAMNASDVHKFTILLRFLWNHPNKNNGESLWRICRHVMIRSSYHQNIIGSW